MAQPKITINADLVTLRSGALLVGWAHKQGRLDDGTEYDSLKLHVVRGDHSGRNTNECGGYGVATIKTSTADRDSILKFLRAWDNTPAYVRLLAAPGTGEVVGIDFETSA